MRTVTRTVSAVGPARPVVVWHRYDDLAAWSTWAPQILAVDADGPTLSLGRSGVVRALPGIRVPFVVTDLDADAMTWGWVATLGPLHLTLHHTVAPDPRGTRAGLSIEGPRAVIAAYAPLARIALGRLVRA